MPSLKLTTSANRRSVVSNSANTVNSRPGVENASVSDNGNLITTKTEDVNLQDLMKELIAQQRITNLHLSVLSDNEFTEYDL
jgi:hypothetical protein